MRFCDDTSGFVLLRDVIPDLIEDMRYFTDFNFIGERIDGYEEGCAVLTEQAAKALGTVAGELRKKGYLLKIFDAYRPQCAVDHFVRWASDPDDVRMKEFFYPDIDKKDVIPLGYVAEYSSHTRGSTADLTLYDISEGREADMGSSFDFFGRISHPDCRDITEEQYENRMILREAMIRGGFEPYEREWWHFSLKDEPYPDTYFTFPVNSEALKNRTRAAE